MLFTYEEISKYKLYSETFSLINSIYIKLDNTNFYHEFEFVFDGEESTNSFFEKIRGSFKYLYDLIYMHSTELPEHEGAVESLNMYLRDIQVGIIHKTEYLVFASLMDALLIYFNNIFVNLGFYKRLNNESSPDEKILVEVVNKILNVWADKGKDAKIQKVENYKQSFSDLESKIIALNETVEQFQEKQKENYENFIDNAREKVNEEIFAVSKNYQSKIDNFFSTIDQDVIDKVEGLKDKLANTETVLKNLDIGINSYNSMVSEKVENEFSKYYLRKAREEKKIYYSITIFSIILLVTSIVLAWFSLSKYYNNYVDPQGLKNTIKGLTSLEVEWVQQAAFLYLSLRLVISILIFLSVIYTGRIAYRAYLHWRHSENTHLKLASLRPFINDLPLEDITQIRKNLVPDFFGKDAGNIDTNNESFKDLPSNVSALAAKAIEQVGNNIGTKTNTEKNDKKSESGTE
ncbi:hypothetical protein ACSNOU_14765 [Acinetobacter oleivorans]|uniref:hypothetical protein n=1 Tax=Acinetobacter oleivorans TaxID=1148157 RepID=UPI003F1E3EBE